MKLGRLKEIMPYFIVKDKMGQYDFKSIKDLSISNPPCVFNSRGEKMSVFYLKDSGNGPYSLSLDRYPNNILWDRFNINIDCHFYVHENIFGNTYECRRKYGILRESEEIVSELYKRAIDRSDIIKEYTAIFSSSERILNRYENAKFCPANSVWYGTNICGGFLSDKAYEHKNKNISIIASNKTMCKLHKVRAELAKYYMKSDCVDSYGRAVNRYIEKKSDALQEYRYSIIIENSVAGYYFTEKIMDCFASMTVPIYVGATNIGEFFNENGIIRLGIDTLDDFSNVDKIINGCCEKDYYSRIEAIKDNYKRVQEYLCFEDYLYNHYEELRK